MRTAMVIVALAAAGCSAEPPPWPPPSPTVTYLTPTEHHPDTSAPRPTASRGQLERMLADLTGFVWQADTSATINGLPFGHIDYLDDDYFGFRVLGGGIDSWYVTQPTHTMNATASLVARRVARLAAAWVVEHDAAAAAADRRLLTLVAIDAPDPESVRAELADLHGRIYSELVSPDDPALDATQALFDDALAASADPRRAWTVTLTGMLSDLRAVYY